MYEYEHAHSRHTRTSPQPHHNTSTAREHRQETRAPQKLGSHALSTDRACVLRVWHRPTRDDAQQRQSYKLKSRQQRHHSTWWHSCGKATPHISPPHNLLHSVQQHQHVYRHAFSAQSWLLAYQASCQHTPTCQLILPKATKVGLHCTSPPFVCHTHTQCDSQQSVDPTEYHTITGRDNLHTASHAGHTRHKTGPMLWTSCPTHRHAQLHPHNPSLKAHTALRAALLVPLVAEAPALVACRA